MNRKFEPLDEANKACVKICTSRAHDAYLPAGVNLGESQYKVCGAAFGVGSTDAGRSYAVLTLHCSPTHSGIMCMRQLNAKTT